MAGDIVYRYGIYASHKRLNNGSLKGWLLGLKGYWAQIHNLVMN